MNLKNPGKEAITLGLEVRVVLSPAVCSRTKNPLEELYVLLTTEPLLQLRCAISYDDMKIVDSFSPL